VEALALPEIAYDRLTIQPAILTTIRNAGVQLIVVDTVTEVVVTWNHYPNPYLP
jgi:hypothetical protein